jgi:hypothetical protein
MSNDNPRIDPMDPPKVDASGGPYMSRYSSLEKAVDSRLFITAARLIMIFAGSVGLPVAGFLMMKLIGAAGEISTQVNETAIEVKLFKQEFRANSDRSRDDINRATEWLRDHEGRIRVLERAGNPLPTRPN